MDLTSDAADLSPSPPPTTRATRATRTTAAAAAAAAPTAPSARAGTGRGLPAPQSTEQSAHEVAHTLTDEAKQEIQNLKNMLTSGTLSDQNGTLIQSRYYPTRPWRTLSEQLPLMRTEYGYGWFPQLFLPSAYKFECYHCGGTDTILHGHSRPRRVCCWQQTTWLVAQVFKCNACFKAAKKNYTFNAHDVNALARMPPHVARLYPLVTTDEANNSWLVESDIIYTFISLRLKGVSFSAMAALVYEAHERNYANQLSQYLFHLLYLRNHWATNSTLSIGSNGQMAASTFNLTKRPFPPQDACPVMAVPTVPTFQALVGMVYKAREKLQDHLMGLIGGQHLKGDASFKLAAHVVIRSNAHDTAVKPFTGYVVEGRG